MFNSHISHSHVVSISEFLLSRLSLTYTRYDEYNGTWYNIYKNHFDMFMLEVSCTSLEVCKLT